MADGEPRWIAPGVAFLVGGLLGALSTRRSGERTFDASADDARTRIVDALILNYYDLEPAGKEAALEALRLIDPPGREEDAE